MKSVLTYAGVIILVLAMLIGSIYIGELASWLRRGDTIQYEIETLKEAWRDGDLDYIDCSKRGPDRYRYGELMSLHSAMCTAASNAIPSIGEDWFTPDNYENPFDRFDTPEPRK